MDGNIWTETPLDNLPCGPCCCSGKKTPAKQPDSPKNSFSTTCLFNPGCKWQQTSIKERDFHLCVTRICAYHTVWEHKAIYSGLLGRCHAARVKCCRVGVKQLQISCVCAEECCVFVQRLTNRLPFWAMSKNLKQKKKKTSLSTNESQTYKNKSHPRFNKAVTQGRVKPQIKGIFSCKHDG